MLMPNLLQDKISLQDITRKWLFNLFKSQLQIKCQ